MDERKKRWLIIGGVVGATVFAINSRSSISNCVKSCYEKTSNVVKFLNENRTEVLDQVKRSSDKVSKAIDETNKDLKAISENVKSLKESSSQIFDTIKETKDQFANLYCQCCCKVDGEEADQILDEEKNV